MAVSKKKAAPKKAVKVKEGRGRPKAIETPEKMWELFVEYESWVRQNPIEVQDFVGKDGDEVFRKKNRPLTMEGFEMHVFGKGIATDLDQYFANREGRYSNFVSICSRIRKTIRQDQIEGGMAGIYNPSITQRLNGLVEKVQEDGSKEVTIKVKYEKKETPKE
jgi:hypothetical protein